MNRGRATTTPSSSGTGGRSRRSRGHHSSHRHSPISVGVERYCSDDSRSWGGMSRAMGSSSQKKPDSGSMYSKNASGLTYEPKKPLPNGKDEFPELGRLQHDCTVSESTPFRVSSVVSSLLSNSSCSKDTGKVENEFSVSVVPDHDLSLKMNISSSSNRLKQLCKSDIQFKHSQMSSCEKPTSNADSMGSEYLDMEKFQIRESLDALSYDLFQKVNMFSCGKSKKHNECHIQNSPSQKDYIEKTVSISESEGREVVKAFDICVAKIGAPLMLKPSLFSKNRERRRSTAGLNGTILRPGMVFLKSYLSVSDQSKIVKMCRELGLGSGGFYQPGYRDGAKLHLEMMCLGKNWDPETSKYDDHRSFDGAKPPAIPHEFCQIVEKAMKDSHTIIRKNSSKKNVDEILPDMSPNICIVNFYTASGKLGLHQDRDESQESLRRGLPVVSFSIGDSAEFLYSDQRDVDKAAKILLESGDVLIFGGKSRHIFHGAASINPRTAPNLLLEETNLRTGRLNLTFREY